MRRLLDLEDCRQLDLPDPFDPIHVGVQVLPECLRIIFHVNALQPLLHRLSVTAATLFHSFVQQTDRVHDHSPFLIAADLHVAQIRLVQYPVLQLQQLNDFPYMSSNFNRVTRQVHVHTHYKLEIVEAVVNKKRLVIRQA